MKLGIIRCMQTEDYCPGSRDFRTIRERKGAFMGEDDIQLVGFINCGGCPGKKAVLRARSLVEQGADTIAFASCISKGTPIGYSCPFAKRMRELVQKEVGDGVRILDYTHDAGPDIYMYLINGTGKVRLQLLVYLLIAIFALPLTSVRGRI